MNRTLALAALLLPVILAGPLRAQTLRESEPIPGVVLVKFAPDALPELAPRIQPVALRSASARSLLEGVGFVEGRRVFEDFRPADTLAIHRASGEPVALLDLSRWYLLQVDAAADVQALARQLAVLPSVEAAVPEYLVQPATVFPNDLVFQQGYQWGLRNLSYAGSDIHAPQAWEYNRGRNDVVVAVVDGGIDYTHPDLDPGNRSRIIQGYDTADGDSDPMDDIPSAYAWANHGTLIAGIIGAITNNGSGVAGVMWNVQVMPVKIAYTNGPWWNPFTGAGTAYRANIGQGIEYARTHGADIINLSLGSPASQAPGTFEHWFSGNPMVEAIVNAYRQGLLIFAASGNNSQSEVGYPAFHPLAIAVGNSTITDARYWDSNYGSALDFVAPGTDYHSTYRGGTTGGIGAGTSFASPMAAAVGGLVLSESRDLGLNLTNDDIRQILRRSADAVPGMQGQDFHPEYGYGRVNAAAALAMINPPNTITHLTRSSGVSTLTWNTHQHTFLNGVYGAGGFLAAGAYSGVKQYRITGRVTFSSAYRQTPEVWVRERQTTGWNGANPNTQSPNVQITNVTSTGFDYQTFVYWIGSASNGQSINQYYPAAPGQLTLAFTVVGEPAPLSASFFGPTDVYRNEQAVWYSTTTGGTTPYTYQWHVNVACPPPPPCTGNVCTHSGEFRQPSPPATAAAAPDDGPCGVWQSGGTSSSLTETFQASSTRSVTVRLKVTDAASGTAQTWIPVTVMAPPGLRTGEDALVGVSYETALVGVRPNPLGGSASVSLTLAERLAVTVTVYDALGREVVRLTDGVREAGAHTIPFDGHALPSGVYMVRMQAGAYADAHRISVVN